MNSEKLSIVKIGGNVIDDSKILSSFLQDFSNLEGYKILVHGGGKEATRLASKLGIETIMMDGRRVTDKDMLDVTVMTYAGLCNKKIVAKLQALGTPSMGLTGADGNSILSKKRENSNIDYGFVGDVISVNSSWIKSLLEIGTTPVFCAITHDKKGQLLNTNADTIAQSLATGLAHLFNVSLTYCFEKRGVLLNIDDENSVIESLNFNYFQELKTKNIIHSGMLPKLENCFQALQLGVKEIRIANPEIIKNPNLPHTYISM
ncbi:acetylglutamate kinase [Apibacter muscae]|uniref:acetylglutamate kinase n=1 Tax=Apibacter muscae TaxID=2509004 RepID=UPI0011AD47E0|nr:acetylglutamate kinase [Apibacter muscae]TWP30917.1 acetylglutamate kinase [Apibacter muscae]